jgi:hypothetical protein
MKLNPPASSSDLELARAIARRLHQRTRASDATPGPAPDEALRPAFDGRPSTPSAPVRRAPPPPPPAPEPPEPEPELQPEPAEPQPQAPDQYTPDTGSFGPAAAEESAPEPSPFEPEPPGGYTVDTGSLEPEAPEEPAPEPAPSEPEPPGAYSPDTGPFQSGPSDHGDEAPAEGDAGADAADDALSELTGPPEEPALEELEPPGGAGVSPEDLIPDEPEPGGAWSESSPAEEVLAPGSDATPTGAEDLVEVAAPSWDDIADSCLALASADGTMLVDPAGQVLSARGDWPEPGPEAIAGRLFSMMEKKLRDAPTRSVSAPLAGKHLTAWRVPGDGGYLTVVFMAPAPLRADVRPPIDATIQASVG